MSAYHDRVIQHSLMWVNGVCKHNKIDDECLADFSCCHPELFTENKEKRMRMHKDLVERLRRFAREKEKDKNNG